MRNTEEIILNNKIMNGVINIDAVFSDETEMFLYPFEPEADDEVKVRLRVGIQDADEVYLVSDDEVFQMKFEKSKGIFDYYFVIIPPEDRNRSYYFKIVSGEEVYYFNRFGVSREPFNDGRFVIDRKYKTPDWAKGAIGYQIYVDRFFNGDKTNDVVNNEYVYLEKSVNAVDDWNKLPEVNDVFNFYGGDLQGVIDKLDYLSSLGIEMIYFNPIFVSPSNHKYDIQDYEHIDPHFGRIVTDADDSDNIYAVRTARPENLEASDALFAELVSLAHERNIKVVIDGVFNHCGSFNKWLDKEKIYEKTGGYEKGAYGYEDSPYRSFFKWNENKWPDNEEYDAWWGHKNHPKLNYEESEMLYEYIMKVAEKWISPPYNADGWRVDVAADIGFTREFNHKFWKDFRKRIKKANPNAVIIAEHYGDANEWLQGDEWDTVMNYDAFMEPVTWFFTGMEKHSDSFDISKFRNGNEFERLMVNNTIRMGTHALMVGMNELSNHDHSRFLTRTNLRAGRLAGCGSRAAEEGVNYGIMREAVAFQFIWPGLPTIYYGDEAGVAGWTDPDNRRTYPWGMENKELIDFHREIIRIRKENPVLRFGAFRFIYSDYGITAVSRFDDDVQISAAFNNCNEDRTINLPVWLGGAKTEGIAECIMESTEYGFTTEKKEYQIKGGYIELNLKPYSCILLKSE